MHIQSAFFEAYEIRLVYERENRNLVVLGGGYHSGADTADGLSDCTQVLEQTERAARQGRKPVGYKL